MTTLGLRLAAAILALAACTEASAACNVSPQAVIFGTYDPLSPSALDGVGNVNVACDTETSFTISLSPGNGTVADRRMNGGATQLAYNLYKDASRVIIWGEGLDSVSSTGTNVDLPVYGRIPGMQNVSANVYVDTIAVTVTY